jgi:hypothetical protein
MITEDHETMQITQRKEPAPLKIILQRESMDKKDLTPIIENLRTSNDILVYNQELGLQIRARVRCARLICTFIKSREFRRTRKIDWIINTQFG